MSFATFPSSLPYFASLHDQDLLDQEIDALHSRGGKKGQDTATDVSEEDQAFMRALTQVQNLSVTTNGAMALSTSEDPCLDLYASMVGKDCPAASLDKAYKHNPLLTLKLIFHCRSIHHGKMNKMGFYTAFLWLLKHHPKTALRNLHVLVDGTIPSRPVDNKQQDDEDWELLDKDEQKKQDDKPIFYKTHGYWKDLLNLLCVFASEGLGATEFTSLNCPRKPYKSAEESRARRQERRGFYKSLEGLDQATVDRMRKDRAAKDQERRAKAQMDQANARRQLRHDRHQNIVHLLKTNGLYRALHFTVARLFAAQLKKDQETVLAFDKSTLTPDNKYVLANQLSLAGKWAPTLACAHDKQTLIATSIAEILFLSPNDPMDIGNQEQRKFQLNAARDQYRRHITTPLRQALEITERSMSRNEWKQIDFSHVPSICMQNNSKHFLAHTPTEYQAFLRAVVEGRRKVSGAVLGPHEFVERAADLRYKDMDDLQVRVERDLLDGQWATYVRSVQEACGPGHALRSSLAVCDVSGSMTYGANSTTPLNAAVGLSLTLMALAAPPFTGTMISFSESPHVISVDTSLSFVDQVTKVMDSEWGNSTNLYSVFVDLLLPMAKKYNLKQEDMVKRLFVFTDMQFDGVDGEGNPLDTFWESVVKAYDEAGYVPPEIVWWNLSLEGTSELTLQATKDTENVAMVAGFSQNMLKNFMDGEQVATNVVPPSSWELREQAENEKAKMTPTQVMMDDLGKDSFSSLMVYD